MRARQLALNRVDVAWTIGRLTIGSLVRIFAPLRVYGKERIPAEGGVVLAFNHFSWIDPPAFGTASPRTIYFMAKIEAHRVPGPRPADPRVRHLLGAARRVGPRGGAAHARGRAAAGTRSVCSPRERASGPAFPGKVQPGAAMVALQEGVPVVPAAIHGSHEWRPGNWQPVSIVWGEPMRFDGLPKNGKGYREASAEIEREIHRLWRWLAELHEAGRPAAVELP